MTLWGQLESKERNTNLCLMGGTFWNHFPTLSGHQIQKLVDKKGGRESHHPTPWDGDKLAANRASELPRVSGKCSHNSVQTMEAHGVWTRQQFGVVFLAIVHSWNYIFFSLFEQAERGRRPSGAANLLLDRVEFVKNAWLLSNFLHLYTFYTMLCKCTKSLRSRSACTTKGGHLIYFF